MKTTEIINLVCSELGISKADIAKKMGMLPSSLYRKLARESMTLEELQQCLDAFGITIEFNIIYPDGSKRSSQSNYERLLERMDILESELKATKKTAEFQKNSLRDLRTELNSAVGYVELGCRHTSNAGEYMEKIQPVLNNMKSKIACALGEAANDDPVTDEPVNIDALKGRRVLIVDDNQLNREIMREILVDKGLEVSEADNGLEALETVKNNEPGYYHFILMDIEMPVMDGYESTLRIRKLPNRMRANVPIIALTANAYVENRYRAEEVGMDDFLTKPINSNRLLGILTKYQ